MIIINRIIQQKKHRDRNDTIQYTTIVREQPVQY